MGYNYRESGYGRCDYLIVTKKGKEEGRLPDGIVILTGQLYADPEFKAWLPTAEEKGYHVFVAHNHPSGDVSPSKMDMQVMTKIKDAGEILSVPLLDFIICGECYYSAQKEGCL